MIETPEVLEKPGQPCAAILLSIPRSEIREAMGPGLNEILAAVKEQGAGPAGPWFTHHLRMDPARFHFEICIPVTTPVRGVGRVFATETPAVKAARTVYRGGYEGLGEAWREFHAWIRAERLDAAIDLYECYVKGPESGSDPAEWQTELWQPLL